MNKKKFLKKLLRRKNILKRKEILKQYLKCLILNRAHVQYCTREKTLEYCECRGYHSYKVCFYGSDPKKELIINSSLGVSNNIKNKWCFNYTDTDEFRFKDVFDKLYKHMYLKCTKCGEIVRMVNDSVIISKP
jgi:hypothetical protein